MTEKTKNLGLRATEKRWRELNQLALDRGTSVQRLFDSAIQQVYFDGKMAKEENAAAAEDEAVSNLRAYLAIAERYPEERPFADALKTNILIFWKEARRRRPKAG